ncbi:MAG: hypothetical protein ACLS2V_12640 [Clostridium paraputrificum]
MNLNLNEIKIFVKNNKVKKISDMKIKEVEEKFNVQLISQTKSASIPNITVFLFGYNSKYRELDLKWSSEYIHLFNEISKIIV